MVNPETERQLTAIPNRHHHAQFRWLFLAFFILTAANGSADLAMETETARILRPGHFEISAAFEFQTAPSGKEDALAMAFEVGLYHHLELLIEPVPITSTRASATVTIARYYSGPASPSNSDHLQMN
jgi:hypothetical protein